MGPEPLRALTSAHEANFRGETDRAAVFLDEIVASCPGSTVATEALLLLGAVAWHEGNHERALAVYARVMDESPSLTARAEALVRAGDILLYDLSRPDEAVELYAQVLSELPLNALSGEARRKIEVARGKGEAEG